MSASPAITPALLSYSQAAHYLGLPSAGALRMLVYRGQAPRSFTLGKRDRRFRVADIDAWLQAKAAGSERREAIEQAKAAAEAPPRRRGRPTKVEQIERRRDC